MILGIDPGVRKLGYALIDENLKIVDAGILLQKQEKPQRIDQFDRMIQIADFFTPLFQTYPITTISMEQLFFTKFNQNNAEFVFGIRAILITMAMRANCHIREFTPIELKKYITGNGKAEKMLVQKMIMKLFRLQECPLYNDAADALGLAYLALVKKETRK